MECWGVSISLRHKNFEGCLGMKSGIEFSILSLDGMRKGIELTWDYGVPHTTNNVTRSTGKTHKKWYCNSLV